MTVDFIRSLRTPSSERFILKDAGGDIGALDLHYLRDGTVQATLILIEAAGTPESQVPALLTHIDEVLLPEVSLDDRKLVFTVVMGRVLGAFESQRGSDSTAEQQTD